MIAIIAASQVAQILVSWTTVSVARFGTEEFIETEKIARIFWLRLFILVPNILLALLASGFWFPPLSIWLKLPAGSFWFVVFHFVATALWMHVQYGLQGAKLPREQGFLLMFERVCTFSGILILLGIGQLSPLSALVCYSISPILMVLVGTFYLRRFVFARFSFDLQYIKKILIYSLPLLPFSLVGYFSGSYVDAIFVSNFLSTKDLGIYSVATQINGIALQLPTLANSLLLPLFISLEKENEMEKLKSFFTNSLPSLTVGWGIFCSILGFGGYFVIPLVFGQEFAASVNPFWILLTSSVFALPVGCGYSALLHTKSITYIATISAVFSGIVNIAANFWLIPRYGIEGCAWATAISYFVSMGTFAYLLRGKTQMPVSWLFLAFLPNLAATICYLKTENILITIAFFLVANGLLIYLKRSSINLGVGIFMRFVGK